MLSGCAGFTGGGGSGGGGGDGLSMVTWGQDAEQAAFRRLAQAFQERSGVTVDIRFVPYAEMFTTIDAQLQDGSAPDIFRVDYTSLGSYSSTDQLLDLSDHLDEELTGDLIPAFAEAVAFEGRPYGVPHQTDTTATIYRTDLLREAGITSVPDRLEDAWTWEEFDDVLARLQNSLPGDVAPYSYMWQQAGAFRWLNWVFQADGRLLNDDLTGAAIDSPAGRRALEVTQALYERGLVPANTSPKSSVYADDAFVGGTTAMGALGNFVIPAVDSAIGSRFEWAATYHPQDVRAASDLGGNALVASKQARNPELAGEFLRFMMEPENQRSFCEETIELPTRQSLAGADLDFAVRPDLAPVFTAQATTLTAEDVAQVTVPGFGQINTALQEQLEQCFVGGRSVEATLSGISDRIDEILAA
jgi:multiple sugar transport system substrate-binding protein